MSSASRASVGPYTWDDFIALDDGDLRELIDGELVEVEVPKRAHEYVVGRFVFFLTTYAEREGGEVLPSGYKVRISPSRGVMPDVQITCPASIKRTASFEGGRISSSRCCRHRVVATTAS